MSKSSIKHQDFFVIRTPRMPVNKLLALGKNIQQTNQAISSWLAQPTVKEALYLASPSLFERIEALEQADDSSASNVSPTTVKPLTTKQKKSAAKQEKKQQQALLKYMIRMCSRPTPFGLFSGIHMGEISTETQLLSNDLADDSRTTRLDIFYLSAIKEYLLKNNVRSEQLKYYPNSSHYFVAEHCRYIEAYQSDKTRQYRLSAIESDEHFCFMLEQAKQGLSFNQLVNAFLKRFSDSNNTKSVTDSFTNTDTNENSEYAKEDREQVEDYLQELIDESILLADIPLPLTGDAPDKALINSLNCIEQKDMADHLSTVLHQLQQVDNKKLGAAADYRKIMAQLNKLPVKTEENKLFQTDVYRSFHDCSLDENQLNKLLKQLKLVKALSAQRGEIFSDFISQFNQRFEGQFVPLDKLLDEESGIGFSNETGYEAPLLSGLHLRKSVNGNRQSKGASSLDHIISQAISLPENRDKSVIQLTSKALNEYISKPLDDSEFPASFAAMISLFEDDSQQQDKLLMKFNGCYGPSAANLLGRFCHLNDDFKNNVVEHLNKESEHSPDVIFAEIVHMPEGRPGNVIARPHLRKYEIVFLADSSLADEFQIPISDLYVWVEAGHVKLWSKRLNKQIIPRLSSAHNTSSRSLSAYRFLSQVQYQGASAPSFSMPESQNSSCFVPRVMLDNLILSVKTWRIPRKALVELLNIQWSESDASNIAEIDEKKWQSLKAKYQLDDHLAYAFSDNVLQLNITNPMMLEVLLAETKGQTQIELKEVLTSQYSTPVKSHDGQHYANELIVPFFNSAAKVHQHFTDKPQEKVALKPIKRRFSPGSEWLSLKIYSGNTAVDTLLFEQLLPLIEQCAPLYNKWFFIRYGDPKWHLRLRFFGNPALLWGELLPKLNQLLDSKVEQGEIHKTEVFTYEREVERYGGADSMALVESLFMTDSSLIAKTAYLEANTGEELRSRVALLMTDTLLTAFDYSEEEKLEFITGLRAGFGREFNESSLLRKQLGTKFKPVQATTNADFSFYHQKSIAEHDDHNEVDDITLQVYTLVNHWQQESSAFINDLKKLLTTEGGINCSKNTLLSSILHMHNNRMFKAYGREHELVMHDFLRRYYFSQSKKPANKKIK